MLLFIIGGGGGDGDRFRSLKFKLKSGGILIFADFHTRDGDDLRNTHRPAPSTKSDTRTIRQKTDIFPFLRKCRVKTTAAAAAGHHRGIR